MPLNSMTMVRSRLVKTEGIPLLFVGGVVVEASGALAASWAQLSIGSGAIGLERRVVVVAGAGCLLCCCCS